MALIYAKHPPYETGHLGEVVADMERLGAPNIRAIWFGDRLCALEGSHRLAAAHYLGLTPLILTEEPDTEFSTQPAALLDDLPAYEMPAIVMSAAILGASL